MAKKTKTTKRESNKHSTEVVEVPQMLFDDALHTQCGTVAQDCKEKTKIKKPAEAGLCAAYCLLMRLFLILVY